ncbi:hypothetical protein BDQ12DRAFT_735634 [Crucibulum laeve]|uniref:F-box domain-containing protein n=1 Tax=Crucibulum laeve TaxID=68775 RepID=A0A5C3LZM2_9AGAR|nr:hypothetical protein BDQ12DRAFT_735634 [Crucibulum laeve]
MQLPPEIWLDILDLTADSELFKVESVNRIFYGCALDRRYRHIQLHDKFILSGIIDKLDSDYFVLHKRVKSLEIYPHLMLSAMWKGIPDFLGVTVSKAWVFPVHIFSKSGLTLPSMPPLSSISGAMEGHFMTTMAKFTALKEIKVTWTQNPNEDGACFSVLNILWPVLFRNLVTLNLRTMPIEIVDCLSESISTLTHVKYLTLSFEYNFATSTLEVAEALVRIAKSVNCLAGSLRSLSISGFGNFDFSPFYDVLEEFPHLSKFVHIGTFGPEYMNDPAGFKRFLMSHSSIRHLILPAPGNSAFTSVDSWLQTCFEGIRLPNLRTLELSLSYISSSGNSLPLLLAHITETVDTIESFSITGCRIPQTDLELVLQLLTGLSLKSVKLEVLVLDPALMDLFAKYLPDLETLDLTYRWVCSTPGNMNTSFVEEMERRFYPKWKLYEAHLESSDYCANANENLAYQKAISRCAPRMV